MTPTNDLVDARCPECGGPIGPGATACLHCSADLDGKQPLGPEAVPADSPDAIGATGPESAFMNVSTTSSTPAEYPLDPAEVMDDTLTVVVGLVGGFVVGLAGTVVLFILLQSAWAVAFGLAVWLGFTAYLVRRRYLMDAVAKSAYGVAAVILTVPILAVVFEQSILQRAGIFAILIGVVIVPAGVAAGIGWLASRYVPADARGL